MSNRVKYRYIGEGAFVVGLPARDIREEETAEFEELVEANMQTSNPCYRLVGERTHHKAQASDAKPPPEDKQRNKGAEE